MAKYIDKDKLLDDLNWYAPSEYNAKVNEVIIKQPEADVVEVVHCKNCKYYQDNNGGYPHPDCKWGNGETPDEDDFCSAGERK